MEGSASSDMTLNEYIEMRKKELREKERKRALADKSPFEMSLDEYIQAHKGEVKSCGVDQGEEDEDGDVKMEILSEEEEEMLRIDYDVETRRTLGGLSTKGGREYQSEDVYKSLDEVVEARGILKPPKYKTGGRVGEEESELPISGRRKEGGKAGGRGEEESGQGSKSVKFNLNPATSSLDDIIADRGISDDNKSTGRPKRKAESNGGFEGGRDGKRMKGPRPILPHMAVGFLAEKGMIIELKIGRLVDEEKGNPLHLWRCIVTCGAIKGMCDSARKVVAREIACRDFLDNLIAEYPLGKVPKFELPEEVFIDPRVVNWIEKLAQEEGEELTHELVAKTVDPVGMKRDDPWYEYTWTYFLGDQKFIGRSTEQKFARLQAARKVHQELTREMFQNTRYFTGSSCEPEVEYNFNESEVYHTLDNGKEGDEDFPIGKFRAAAEDKEEILRKKARETLLAKHKQAKKDEEDKRRNMNIDLSQPIENPKEKPATSHDDPGPAEEQKAPEQTNIFLQPPNPFSLAGMSQAGRGRGRGRKVIKMLD